MIEQTELWSVPVPILNPELIFNIQQECSGRVIEWSSAKPIPYGWVKCSPTWVLDEGEIL